MAGEAPAARAEATRFGKYVPIANLGQGGMADVLLAVVRGPMDFQKLVVLKMLRAGYAGDAEVRGMFLDEARLAARLNHVNVVDTYEVGEEDGVLFLAMEYLEGQPLSAVVAEARLCGERTPPGLALRIVSDALNGLHYAHELADFDGSKLHIVHRDVSPHNIFVTYDGRVKLMDFGIAKAAYSVSRTDAGMLKGKVRYMAPEQARGQEVDLRADVFAMGICLWELLTNAPLLPLGSPMSALHKLTNEVMPSVTSVAAEIDPRLAAIVARALEPEPSGRWESAAAMREAIEEYLREAAIVVHQADVAKHMGNAFAEMREQVKAELKAHMANLPASGTDPARPKARLGSIVARNRLLDLARRPLEPTGGGLAHPGETPEAAHRRRLTLAVAMAVPLLATALVVGFSARRADDLPTTAPSGAPSAQGAPDLSAAPPLPTIPAVAALEPPAPAATPDASARVAHVATPRPPGRGFLTIDTYPWSRVSEGGRVLGVTPLVDIPLAAGPHTLTLDNPDTKVHRTLDVTLKPGEHLSKRVTLD